MAKQKYNVVSRQISHDIVTVAKQGELTLDEVVLLVAAPITQLDFSSLSPKEKELRHIARMERFLGKNRGERFYHYTREAVREALQNEFLPVFEDDMEAKMGFVSDIKLIEDITPEGDVVLQEKLFNAYANLPDFEAMKYGSVSLSGRNPKGRGSAKPREVLTHVNISADMETALQPFIALYKKFWGWDVDREHYKWDAVSIFQQKFDIDAPDLSGMLQNALNPTENLLAGPFYYARSMMVQFAEHSPEETRAALLRLLDEEKPLAGRVEVFLDDCKEILAKNMARGLFKQTDHTQQSERSASVYLSLMYPSKHYLYKASMYYDFKRVTELDLPVLSRFESKLVGYEKVCDCLRQILIRDEELLAMHDKSYPNDTSDYHLMTQDFIYFVAIHIEHLKSLTTSTADTVI